jgi:hypothetical protein
MTRNDNKLGNVSDYVHGLQHFHEHTRCFQVSAGLFTLQSVWECG